MKCKQVNLNVNSFAIKKQWMWKTNLWSATSDSWQIAQER